MLNTIEGSSPHNSQDHKTTEGISPLYTILTVDQLPNSLPPRFFHTKHILEHKSIQNTIKYTHLVHFKDDEFDVATATTVEEEKDLAATGFDYFTTMNGAKLFRKRK